MDPATARALSDEGLDDGGGGAVHTGGSGGDMASRRSGRSIKRKKFDDELVDSMSTSYPKPLKPPSTEQEMLEGVFEGVSSGELHSTPLRHFHVHLENGSIPLQHQPPMMQSKTAGALLGATAAFPPSLSVTSASLSSPATPIIDDTYLPPPVLQKSNKSKKKTGNEKQGNRFAEPLTVVPENNYWKPADDLALITNVEQTCDLEKVHQGVKFSIPFSLAELEARWHSLLYDVHAKNLSMAAIRQLHADVVTEVKSRALYSEEEEAILQKVPSLKADTRTPPTLEDFQEVLEQHSTVFLAERTAKLLRKHWVLLRHYQLLEDQSLVPLSRHESVINFSEIESIVKQELVDEARMKQQFPSTTTTPSSAGWSSSQQPHLSNLQHHFQSLHLQSSTPQTPGGGGGEGDPWQSPPPPSQQLPTSPVSEAAHQEIVNSFRKSMLEIRMLENEIPKYQFLLDSITGVFTPSDFDQHTSSNTFAVLRGRLVRYLMRSCEVTIGRSTKDFIVDVDLSLEGPSSKISRMQAIIRLAPTGEFNLFNAGKRPVFVDGKPVLKDDVVRLHDKSLVELSTLKFIFLINQDLVLNMRNEELLRAG